MAEKTIKIAFRGLMVMNLQEDAGKKFMEIGFLDARIPSDHGNAHTHGTPVHTPVHVPRILKMENGLLAEVFDLRNRPELGKIRNWELRVTNAKNDLEPFQPIMDFNRKTKPTTADEKSDFRWIIDWEGPDMHKVDLTPKIGTGDLLMVLTVRNGKFVTRMHSPRLIREDVATTATVDYGFAAAVTGCDITFESEGGGGVSLIAASTVVKDFVVTDDVDTIFEISNSPPDVTADGPTQASHFHTYYDKLFIGTPDEQFDLIPIGGAPAPDPVLCSVMFLSQRTDSLNQ